jgi:aminoglycoside phosphotransferase family enzyme/predicted kinase
MDPALLRRLHEPDCFPGGAERVEVRQTHLSVVCLVGEEAYKLKKPVRFSFVDFTDPEQRRRCCEEEVRLNRRLCPGVYLGVAPLYRDPAPGGRWSFVPSPGATVVDHAVRMRRLPEERLLSHLLAQGEVTTADAVRLAELVAAFHRDVGTSDEAREAGGPEQKQAAILGNFEATEALVGSVFPSGLYRAVEARARRDLEALLPRLRRRAAEGRIVDGHGDLHARNIFLTEPPVIFDCIEFRPSFRCGDVAFEVAFLVMDFIHRGRPDLARAYLAAYVARSGDTELPSLMPAAISYRAMVRAKVASLAASDPGLEDADREAERAEARRYLRLAAASALGDAPLLVFSCGLPGSGKSHLLEALARCSGWPCLASDRLRKELAGVAPTDPLPEEAYTPEARARTYGELVRRAGEALEAGPVLLDANFPTRRERARVRALAERAGGRAVALWIRGDEALVRERLAARERGETVSASDAGVRVYEQLRGGFEEPQEDEGMTVIPVDGGADAEDNLDRILARFLETSDVTGG